jgi:hypothetical protein
MYPIVILAPVFGYFHIYDLTDVSVFLIFGGRGGWVLNP